MTPEQATEFLRRFEGWIVAAEAEQVAGGWRFLTVDGLTVESGADLVLYEGALRAFRRAADGRECRQAGTSSRLTLGIRGGDADERIAALRAGLEELNPPIAGPGGWRRWEIRDGAR